MEQISADTTNQGRLLMGLQRAVFTGSGAFTVATFRGAYATAGDPHRARRMLGGGVDVIHAYVDLTFVPVGQEAQVVAALTGSGNSAAYMTAQLRAAGLRAVHVLSAELESGAA